MKCSIIIADLKTSSNQARITVPYKVDTGSGNRKALLGMPNIVILDILAIKCNTIGTQEANKYNTNTDNSQGSIGEQLYTNTRQEGDRPKKCYTNTDNSNSKSSKVVKPMVDNN